MCTREELLQKAKYVLFPNRERYANFAQYPSTIIKFPIIENAIYKTYKLNEHHFKPFYFKDYVLPLLEDVLQMGYNINDFDLIIKEDNGNDISHLNSKYEFKFDIYGLTKKTENLDVNFAELRNCQYKDYGITEYHKLFIHPHTCSKIINKTINSNRVLVLSCDSHMIPIIPVLCCYFKEIYVLDNRLAQSFIQDIDINKVTDVLIAGGFNPEWKYLSSNLQ